MTQGVLLPALAATLLFGSGRSTRKRPARQRAGGLEQIVVTARFREENLQEIPLAMSAFTAEALAANGATSVLDVDVGRRTSRSIRSAKATAPPSRPTCAASATATSKPPSEPTVTFYVDDVVLGRPTGAIMDLLDLERVEVLRGPQGTLFGKNAIGGVVRMVSRKPGEGDGRGNMEVTLGSYDRLDLRGSFESTLVEDKLFSRVSFVSKTRDGYMDNVDYRCAMIAAGTPQLAGVNDGVVGWNTDRPTLAHHGQPSAARADNDFAVPTKITDRGSNSDCVIGPTRRSRHAGRARHAAIYAERYVRGEFLRRRHGSGRHEPVRADEQDRPARCPRTVQTFNRQRGFADLRHPVRRRLQGAGHQHDLCGLRRIGRVDGGIETPNLSTVKHWGTSATFDVNLDAVQIKVILAHRDFDPLFGQDSDGSPIPYSP